MGDVMMDDRTCSQSRECPALSLVAATCASGGTGGRGYF